MTAATLLLRTAVSRPLRFPLESLLPLVYNRTKGQSWEAPHMTGFHRANARCSASASPAWRSPMTKTKADPIPWAFLAPLRETYPLSPQHMHTIANQTHSAKLPPLPMPRKR